MSIGVGDGVKAGFGAYFGFMLASLVLFIVVPCLACGGCTTITTMLGVGASAANKGAQIRHSQEDMQHQDMSDMPSAD